MSCARTRGRRSPAGAPRCRARHRAASRCLTVMHATSCSLLARRSRLLFSSGSATTRTGARTLRTGGTWSGTTRLTSTPTTWRSSYSSMCAISGGEGDLHRVSRLLQVPPSEERRVLPVLTPFASATRRPSSLRTRRRRRSTLDRRSDSPLACVAGLRPTDGARGAPRGGAASFLSTPRASVLFGIPLDASAARRRSAAPPRSCRAPSPVATSTPRRAARRGGYLGQRRLYAQGTARACPEDAQ